MVKQNTLFRLFFYFKDEVYQIYADNIEQSETMFGFLKAESLYFGDPESEVVIDPSEERLKNEFDSVSRVYIPIQSILRIDEVNKPGTPRITSVDREGKSNVSPFPGPNNT